MDDYQKGYDAAVAAIKKMLSGQINKSQANQKIKNSKLNPIPVPVQIGDKGNEEIQKKEAAERAKNAVEDDPTADQIKQLRDVLNNPAVAKAAINQLQNIKNQERMKRAGDKARQYQQTPLNKFKESINSFIKDAIAERRGTTWSRFNKNYVGTGLIRPGVTSSAPKYIPSINVYFDQSGSWDESKIKVGEQAIATLNQYVKRGLLKINVFYFSNNVHEQARKARAEGGTEGTPILRHVETTRPQNVIVMTDSDISDCTYLVTVEGGVWFLFKGGVSDNVRTHLRGKKFTKSFEI